ncbi:MAG: tetratricopeptide repeat protein [Planctomycetota bacterium]
MNTDRFQRVSELFTRACGLPPADRAVFLADATGEDHELLLEVESLLRLDERMERSQWVDGVESRVGAEAAAALGVRHEKGRRIGPYRVIEPLGVGGMGVVYRAEQDHPRRTVALKVLPAGAFDPSVLRRFQFEAEVLGRLQHPGIAQVYEAGVATAESGSELPYFAMELVEGAPLDRFVERERLDTRERLELLARVCDAVHHAHQKGVIHRDLKPSNVLVRSASPRPGEPKVLDFGVARVTSPEGRPSTVRTLAGQLVGTLPYMSPEQVGGDSDAIDVRADIYSLGAILYELLSGELPIDPGQSSIPEMVRRVVEEQPQRLGRRQSALRGDIETIVAKALEKDPERRYASAAEFAADLRRVIHDEPISARPASRIYVLTKMAKRNRAVVLGSALVFLATLAGLVAERFQRRRAEEARVELEQALGEARAATRSAEAARADLEQALAGSEKVTRILTDLLTSAGQVEEAASPTTVREKLLGIEEQLAGLEGQPEIESRLRNAIGETCKQLGELGLAKRHLERAVELRFALHGDRHPATLRSSSALASVLLDSDDAKRAKQLAEGAFEGFRELLGVEHEETLAALGSVAIARERLGDPSADETHRRVTALCREHLGLEHPLTLRSQCNLAVYLQSRGKSAEAEPLLREVIDQRMESLGRDHPDTAVALNNLGYLLNGTQRFEEALPLLREAFDTGSRFLGEDDARTHLYGNNLGVSYYGLGRYEEARPFLEAAVARTVAELGPDHLNTLLARGNYAGLLRKMGRNEEAASLFPDIVAGMRRAQPSGSPLAAIYERFQGLTLMDLGRYSEAEPLLLGAYQTFEQALGKAHQRTQTARESLIELYQAWGKPDEAERWRGPDSGSPGASADR